MFFEGRIETMFQSLCRHFGLDTCTAPNEVRCKCTAEERRLLDRQLNQREINMTDLYTLSPQEIIFYGVIWCGDCRRARQVFAEKNINFVDVDIDQDTKATEFVKQLNHGYRSVPTIVFPDGSHLTEPDTLTLARKLDNLERAA